MVSSIIGQSYYRFFSQNLLASHDIVAQRDYLPKLSDLPIEVDDDDDEETVKIVQLVKSNEPQVCKVHPKMFGNLIHKVFQIGRSTKL